MLSVLKRITFDIGTEPFTKERYPEIVKCLDNVLSKQGDPFTRLLTSPEMAEVIRSVTGSKTLNTSTGDILSVITTKKYTVQNPWFVQTFHGLDCSEILFDFSAAFEVKEEQKTEDNAEEKE